MKTVSEEDLVRSPHTTVEELLALEVSSYKTLAALIEAPTETSRRERVLDKTILLVLEGKSVRLSMDDMIFDPGPEGTTRSACCTRLLEVKALNEAQLIRVAQYTGLDEKSGRLLAEHPNSTPEAFAVFINAQQMEDRLDHSLNNRPENAGVLKYTSKRHPEKLRLAAELGLLHTRRGRISAYERVLNSLEELWDTPNAAEMLAALRPEWHSTEEKLVQLIQDLSE